MTSENTQTAKRKPGRPAGSTKMTMQQISEDQERIQPTIDRFRAAYAAGVPVKAIADSSGVDLFRLYQVNTKTGKYYGNSKRHITFTDAELVAINKAIDDIKAAL